MYYWKIYPKQGKISANVSVYLLLRQTNQFAMFCFYFLYEITIDDKYNSYFIDAYYVITYIDIYKNITIVFIIFVDFFLYS